MTSSFLVPSLKKNSRSYWHSVEFGFLCAHREVVHEMEQCQFLLEKVFFQVGLCRIVSLYFFVNTPHLLSQSLSPLRNIYKWGNANCKLIRSLSLALSRKERLHTTSFPSRFCALGYAAHTCVPTYWMNPQREFAKEYWVLPKCRDEACDELSSHQEGIEILLVAMRSTHSV